MVLKVPYKISGPTRRKNNTSAAKIVHNTLADIHRDTPGGEPPFWTRQAIKALASRAVRVLLLRASYYGQQISSANPESL